MREMTVIGLIVALVMIIALFPTGLFVNERVAVNALETQGFTNVEVVDRAVFFITLRGGEKTDTVRFTCKATNPIGKRVTVYIFSGWLFKGATIRGLN